MENPTEINVDIIFLLRSDWINKFCCFSTDPEITNHYVPITNISNNVSALLKLEIDQENKKRLWGHQLVPFHEVN